MSSTNSAVQYIAWRSATNTTGALGRNRAYLCIHRNLSGDPALDGHDAEVKARVTQIHELLPVRDGLDCICEFTKNDTEKFLGHICTFLCVMWVGSWRCGCLVARFCCQKTVRLGCGVAAPPWLDPYLKYLDITFMYMAMSWYGFQLLVLIFFFT